MAAILVMLVQITCLISCFQCVFATEYVPVLMWESSSNARSLPSIPALSKFKSSEFKDMIAMRLHQKTALVVFVEENLSVEDFSWKDGQDQSSYPNLQSVADGTGAVMYLPNVHAPLHSLRNLLKKWQHVSLLPEGLKPDVKPSNETRLIVNLVDASENEDRSGLLKRHDTFVAEMYQELVKEHGHVTAIYTAHHSSWSEEEQTVRVRSKREVNEGEVIDNSTLYNGNDRIFLYTSTVPTLILDKQNITLGTPKSVTAVNATGVLAQLEVEYDEVILRFNFRETYAGYWGLRDVDIADSTRNFTLVATGIEAPLTFSYHCSQQVQFLSENKTVGPAELSLTFLSLQVQPFLAALLPGEALPKFSDSYDCVYFFTIPILSGFFVTILFAWIMGLGICMIMDIKTMDRFDDPKGKTINVNAAE